MLKKILPILLLYPLLTSTAYAVIPPDFVFNVGTQIIQFTSFVAIVLTAVVGGLISIARQWFLDYKHLLIVAVILILVGLAATLISKEYFADYLQKQTYQEWLKQSSENQKSNVSFDENDRLSIIETKSLQKPTTQLVSSIDSNDIYSKTITKYYESIAKHDFATAYKMSTKTVDPDTYTNWYINTTNIKIDNLVHIKDTTFSIELTLFEGIKYTRYATIMTLSEKGDGPVRIEKSTAKELSTGVITSESSIQIKNYPSETEQDVHPAKSQSLSITNNEFSKLIASNNREYIVLDARENIEYENGYFPDSVHIRFADLKAGRWIELPADSPIYVFCWSGIRGKEVVEFLKSKNIQAKYLETGASGWVESGGKWIGSIKFADKYSEESYKRLFTTPELKKLLNSNVVIVDSREPYKYKKWHIPGSISIPTMYTPTIKLDPAFNQVPPNSQIITVCDGYVNCFDAKITGAELERRGHTFLGRYSQPWEYDK